MPVAGGGGVVGVVVVGGVVSVGVVVVGGGVVVVVSGPVIVGGGSCALANGTVAAASKMNSTTIRRIILLILDGRPVGSSHPAGTQAGDSRSAWKILGSFEMTPSTPVARTRRRRRGSSTVHAKTETPISCAFRTTASDSIV
jgi:hypothetical protein